MINEKKVHSYVLFALLLLSGKNAFAQDNSLIKCLQEMDNREAFIQFPTMSSELNKFEKRVNQKRMIESLKKNAECDRQYVIPVVFHIYDSNVDDAIVQGALSDLNNDFKGLNPDFGTVDPDFLELRGKANVIFAFAQKDPNGNATSGIIYHTKKAARNVDAWDNYKYMNVYIKQLGGASGSASLPSTERNDAQDSHVTYNGGYLGSNSPSTEIASILTHEFGHFFNLRHTFNGGCALVNDLVEDTPPCQSSQGCSNVINCFGNETNGENYMDYNYSCYKMFTKGQMERFLTNMEHPARVTLWQKSNLESTGLIHLLEGVDKVPIAQIRASALKIQAGESIELSDFSCYGPSSFNWTFEGGEPAVSSNSFEKVLFRYPGNYTVTLVSSNNIGISELVSVIIVVTEAPYYCFENESFESNGQFPLSWSSNTEGDLSFETIKETEMSSPIKTVLVTPTNGDWMLYMDENWGSNGPGNQRLISNKIDLTNRENSGLKFDELKAWDGDGFYQIEVQVSYNSSGPWTTIATPNYSQDSIGRWVEQNDIDLSNYDGEEVYLSLLTKMHHYYWLIDNWCIYSDLEVLSIPTFQFDQLKVYQTNNLLMFNFKMSQIELFDLSGRIVFSTKVNEDRVLLNDIDTGIYIIKGKCQKGIFLKKILIQ